MDARDLFSRLPSGALRFHRPPHITAILSMMSVTQMLVCGLFASYFSGGCTSRSVAVAASVAHIVFPILIFTNLRENTMLGAYSVVVDMVRNHHLVKDVKWEHYLSRLEFSRSLLNNWGVFSQKLTWLPLVSREYPPMEDLRCTMHRLLLEQNSVRRYFPTGTPTGGNEYFVPSTGCKHHTNWHRHLHIPPWEQKVSFSALREMLEPPKTGKKGACMVIPCPWTNCFTWEFFQPFIGTQVDLEEAKYSSLSCGLHRRGLHLGSEDTSRKHIEQHQTSFALRPIREPDPNCKFSAGCIADQIWFSANGAARIQMRIAFTRRKLVFLCTKVLVLLACVIWILLPSSVPFLVRSEMRFCDGKGM